ncbi:MAG: TIGR01244 family protein [Kaistia sp. SCN 65-12]|nr:MAG: TIGR01244 family protein [Kaistia sp. SCN 65-12]
MDIRRITENYSVCPQITEDEVAAVKAAGFRTVICNRPDGEQPGQPAHDAIRAAVEAAGLSFRYIPVVSGQMTGENVADQAAALKEAEGPVLAYCRSGTRCANLFAAIGQARG